MSSEKYTDVKVEIKDGVGTIKFHRPKQLNSFGGTLVEDCIQALRDLNDHPDTTFTVITGEGRFFAAGADVTRVSDAPKEFKHDAQRKLYWLTKFAPGVELVNAMIDHKKVLVLALNGPAVGAGAAWFQGVCDLFYAAEGAWMQVTFSQLGLIPENGSAINWAQHMGVHRTNDWLMFGGKASVEELKTLGLINQIFPKDGFHDKVQTYLADMLKDRDGKSMIEMKRLQNKSLRDSRIISLYDACQSLAEKFVEGEPLRRMTAKMNELADKRKGRASKM